MSRKIPPAPGMGADGACCYNVRAVVLRLFYFNQLNLKVKLLTSHLMVGVKCDIDFIFCDDLDRERLSHLVG